jgi:hypothetical protein
MSNQKQKSVSEIVSFISGSGAGLIADGIVHPIDTVRARLQVQHKKELYNGTIDAFKKIAKNEGIKVFYKGFGIVASFTVPAHGLYFLGYEMFKKVVSPDVPLSEKGALTNFGAGIFADVLGALIWTPMDVVKQRLQVEGKVLGSGYKNSFNGFKKVVSENGVLGLYRGYGASLATFGPMIGIYFMLYEELKKNYSRYTNTSYEQLPFYVHLVFGAFSGGLSAAITCPLDVIKTRIQVRNSNDKGYKTIRQAFTTILKEEGIKGFTKGLAPRMMWIAPNSAITIVAYEQLKRLLN